MATLRYTGIITRDFENCAAFHALRKSCTFQMGIDYECARDDDAVGGIAEERIAITISQYKPSENAHVEIARSRNGIAANWQDPPAPPPIVGIPVIGNGQNRISTTIPRTTGPRYDHIMDGIFVPSDPADYCDN